MYVRVHETEGQFVLCVCVHETEGQLVLCVCVCVCALDGGTAKLQALVYDILLSFFEEGAGKRCSECEGQLALCVCVSA